VVSPPSVLGDSRQSISGGLWLLVEIALDLGWLFSLSLCHLLMLVGFLSVFWTRKTWRTEAPPCRESPFFFYSKSASPLPQAPAETGSQPRSAVSSFRSVNFFFSPWFRPQPFPFSAFYPTYAFLCNHFTPPGCIAPIQVFWIPFDSRQPFFFTHAEGAFFLLPTGSAALVLSCRSF